MELPGRRVCYRALESRDARFDGRIFVGVSSTGVYCRPICPARTPKFEYCSFFPSPTAAQEAGFRPCLRCRPEIAPESASWRGTSNSVLRAIALIAEGALDGPGKSVDKLAARLGMGERQLRRLFIKHLGAPPISVAQTRRILFAKQLIHDTRMPMADVAVAAGFSSVRRFNETFVELFHRPPRALRRKQVSGAQGRDVVLQLKYRPPYDWNHILAFLEARAITGVEFVESERYFRTIEIDGALGSIAVAHLPKRESIEVAILFPNVRALPAIVARIRRLFDIGADIDTINRHLSADPVLAKLITRRPGLRAPGGWAGFEVAVRAVMGQQISVAAARRLAGELVRLHGCTVPEPFRIHPALSFVFPEPQRLVSSSGIRLSMPGTRLLTLRAVAEAAMANPDLFSPLARIEETISRLRTIRGVGEWTAHYIALRASRESDAFPATDVGILRGASSIDGTNVTPSTLLSRAEAWRPWRAYAAQHLWAAGTGDRPNGAHVAA
jgi:AraC family transcriptional regulator of adaptative response / DNA-3-methyladenine glycosylase II